VLPGRNEPLLAAHHVTDAHQMVVDHVRHVVGGKVVGLDQHKVALVTGVVGDASKDHIVETGGGFLDKVRCSDSFFKFCLF